MGNKRFVALAGAEVIQTFADKPGLAPLALSTQVGDQLRALRVVAAHAIAAGQVGVAQEDI